jgi:PAS domain S-box-containing protein
MPETVNGRNRMEPTSAPSSVVLTGSPAESAGASDELLRSAFDRSPSGMSVVALDGHWLRINDAYCRMLGYEREELIGAAFRDFTHPDDVPGDREFVAAAIAGDVDTPSARSVMCVRTVRSSGRVFGRR